MVYGSNERTNGTVVVFVESDRSTLQSVRGCDFIALNDPTEFIGGCNRHQTAIALLMV